ncbi:cell division protein FtsL [Phaeovulum sp.]|uniref:cell division protein FtsL n=1 Tax=Phaeovulum sp. TaxID=2934796 RepID=UPI00356456F2
MRTLITGVAAMAVMGLAFWAYRENYNTQTAISELTRLQAEIASLREGLAVLDAEWAYLNRPDRLRKLAALNFDRLGLLPLTAYQFGAVTQVAYPLLPETGFSLGLTPIDAISSGGELP